MSLKDDVNAGLAELSKAPNLPDMKLDNSGFCRITVPIPPALIKLREGELLIDLQISASGKFFSMLTPVAVLESQPDASFFEALLYRQFYADQVSGASLALSPSNDNDILVAIMHWTFDGISPEVFKKFYQKFIAASFNLIDEVNEMAAKTAVVHPVHEGRN